MTVPALPNDLHDLVDDLQEFASLNYIMGPTWHGYAERCIRADRLAVRAERDREWVEALKRDLPPGHGHKARTPEDVGPVLAEFCVALQRGESMVIDQAKRAALEEAVRAVEACAPAPTGAFDTRVIHGSAAVGVCVKAIRRMIEECGEGEND